MQQNQSVTVEWLILADAAEVVGGKLYLMGGGWTALTVNNQFPHRRSAGVAVAFRIPWHETNKRHEFEIEFATEDGRVIGKANGGFEVGRPPGIPQGTDQFVQMALGANVEFPTPGGFSVTASVGGSPSRVFPFRVVAGRAPTGDGPSPLGSGPPS
jgi:hypothetical protein